MQSGPTDFRVTTPSSDTSHQALFVGVIAQSVYARPLAGFQLWLTSRIFYFLSDIESRSAEELARTAIVKSPY